MSASGPRTIGNFAIERELGKGGMGVVLLGRHASLERLAVLKRLRPELAASDELVERFAREARAAAAVHHQNVVAVYDWISWRGEHYIAQEYVDGVDLRAALHELGSVPWRVAALVGLELARGLEAIHARGTVHRDLKPANVLLGRNGDVKIADFGIALDATSDGLTRPGTTIGTPPYVAPEQILGERVDARGDLFALGVVLYELLAGAPPFREPVEGEKDTLLQRIQRARYTRVRNGCPARAALAGAAGALAAAREAPRPARLRPSSCAGCSSGGSPHFRPTPSSSSRAFSGARASSSRGKATPWCSRRPRRWARSRGACAMLALAAGLAGALALAAHEHRELEQLPAIVQQAYAALARAPVLEAAKLPFSAAAPDAPEAASRP